MACCIFFSFFTQQLFVVDYSQWYAYSFISNNLFYWKKWILQSCDLFGVFLTTLHIFSALLFSTIVFFFFFVLFPKRIYSNTWHKKKYLNVKRDDKHRKKKLKEYFIQHTECSFITFHQFSRLLYFICLSWINDYDVSKIDFIVVWYLIFRCSYLMKSMCNAYKNINS